MFDQLRLEGAIVSGAKLVGVLAAVALLSKYTDGPTHDHRDVIYLWLAIGAVGVIAVAFAPWARANAPGLEMPLLGLVGGLDMAVVFAILSLTGGVAGPFFALVLVNITAAAVIATNRALAAAMSATYIGIVVGSTAVAHTLDRDHAGPLVVVCLSIPLIAILGNAVAHRLELQRAASENERDQLQRTVEGLSAALAQAARGDLSARVDSETVAQELLAQLASSFDDTLGNLRGLVDQVRGGGEQIVAAAVELLASAEQHAASATQQSSAVSETTSTIEELAATAAQIAETSESVARYAAAT